MSHKDRKTKQHRTKTKTDGKNINFIFTRSFNFIIFKINNTLIKLSQLFIINDILIISFEKLIF